MMYFIYQCRFSRKTKQCFVNSVTRVHHHEVYNIITAEFCDIFNQSYRNEHPMGSINLFLDTQLEGESVFRDKMFGMLRNSFLCDNVS